MELIMEAVRWVGLAVALLLTLVVLKEVALVLRTLGDIRALAERIRDASRGLAANVETAEDLPALADSVDALEESGRSLRRAAAALADRLAPMSPPH